MTPQQPGDRYKIVLDCGTGSGRFPKHTRLPNGSIRIRRDWFEEWVTERVPAV